MPSYAIASPLFLPAMRIVTAITNSNPALVTTSFDNNYQDGVIVRLLIPTTFGMPQMNNMVGTVTVINSTTFAVDIDSTLFDPFVVPFFLPWYNTTVSQVVPIGEINSILSQAVHNVLG